MSDIDEINYRLRPAKSMERKMMVDVLQKVGHVHPIRNYRYVGFGSIYFSEFRLFHRWLGIEDMISIERVWQEEPRVEFNKPFKCIKLVMKEAEQALSELEWDKPTILWLDYEEELHPRMLNNEVQQFFANAPAGSVIFLTVHAQPDEIDELEADETHLDQLRDRFGPQNIPDELSETLTGPDYAAAFREILKAQIESNYLRSRNSGLPLEEKVEFNQFFNIVYSDSSLMFTFGGMLNTAEGKERFKEANFDTLDFVSFDEEQYRIPTPSLTFAETRELEEELPGTLDPDVIPAPDKDIADFEEVYRHFPRFIESEL